MKVFVVSMSNGPEGLGDPLGVYSTRESAEAVVRAFEATRLGGIFGAEVIEFELDAPPVEFN